MRRLLISASGIKKWLVLAGVAAIVTAVTISPLRAAITPSPGISSCTDSTSCLKAIVDNTYGILQMVNTFPQSGSPHNFNRRVALPSGSLLGILELCHR